MARSLFAIVVTLLICGVAIATLSQPTERYVYIGAEAPVYSIPADLTLPIWNAVSVQLNGAAVDLKRIATLTAGSGKTKKSLHDVPALAFQQLTGAAASSVSLEPRNRKGPMSIHVTKDTTVEARTPQSGTGLFLSFKSSKGGTTLHLEADDVAVTEADRTALQPDIPPAGLRQGLIASNPSAMVQADSGVSGEVNLVFAGANTFSLLPDNKPLPAASGYHLVIPNCKITSASFRGVKDTDMSLDSPSELDLTLGAGFEWTVLQATSPASPGAPGIISFAARGMVSSLKQDQRQVLPTTLSDWTGADPWTRGLLGGAGVFLIFAIGAVLKRAVDVVSKRLLPD